jgi:GDP-4-dehydro-6-deoxy-D-mannose reductase
MRILVTGASGFTAPYLARELAYADHEVVLTAPETVKLDSGRGILDAKVVDLTDPASTRFLIRDVAPDAVIHLAALSHVGQSWQNRKTLVNVNVNATSNLCQALEGAGKPVTFVLASSAQVYRPSVNGAGLNETSLPDPVTPYGASKLAAEYVVRSFAGDGFKPYIVRPFNNIGPTQSRAFVAAAFAVRVAEATSGGRIKVGNLEARRDFCDVRDVARAYRLIVEKQPLEDLFVLGSGRRTAMRDVLSHFVTLSGKDLTAEVDKSLLRPIDPDDVVSDPTRAATVLGWHSEIPLNQTLSEIFEVAQAGAL